MMDARDPLNRLSTAYRIDVDPETRERHLAEIGSAIKAAPAAPVSAGFGLRRRVAAVVAAIFIVAPAGVAFAAEDSVPGDFLYPVKEVTERVRSLVDHEVEATHRVEEVERLVFLRAPSREVRRAVERAETATSELAEPGELKLRLEFARKRLQQQEEDLQLVEENGSGEDRQESGEGSGKADPGEGSGKADPGEGSGKADPGEGSGKADPGDGSGKADPGGNAGSTAPSGSQGSEEQDQQRSGTTDSMDGQDQVLPESGGNTGSMVGPSGASSTTEPGDSRKSDHP